MTFRTTTPSPSHKSASEASGGLNVQDPNIFIHGRASRIPSAQEKQQAADQMRYQLYLLDRSSQRMSIEDCCAALLERTNSDLH